LSLALKELGCLRTEYREYLDVRGDRRQLYNEELHNLFCSPDTIRTIKSRRVRWMGNVARMGKVRNAYVFSGDLEGKTVVRPRHKWGIVLKQTLKKEVVSVWKEYT
jgi:hypothetical protein